MTDRDPYQVLGVAATASQQEIRTAYLLRTKMMHPDRFDRVKQNAEWELANELLKELNCAYGLLRDPQNRNFYDRASAHKGAASPPRSSAPPPPKPEPPPKKATPPPPPKEAAQTPPPHTNPYLAGIKAGHARFINLPRIVQQRLKGRASGKNNMQYMAKTDDIAGKYGVTLVVFVVLIVFASGFEFKAGAVSWRGAVAFFGLSALFSYHVDWMVRWRQSHLRCWLIVTPLYLLKVHLDQVWYWPIWEVLDIQKAPRKRDVLTRRSSLLLKIGSKTQKIGLVHGKDHQHLLAAVRVYQKRLQLANSRSEWNYFRDEDDFKEVFSTKRKQGRSLFVLLLAFVFCGLLPVAFGFLNKAFPRQAPPPPVRPSLYSAVPPSKTHPKIEAAPTPVPDSDPLKNPLQAGAGEISPPFQLHWGERMAGLERFIESVGAKVSRRRSSSKGDAIEVKGIAVDGLDAAVFYCNDGVLTGVELRYYYPDGGESGWDRRLMSSLITRFDELYGSGLLEFNYDSEMALSSQYTTVVGMMWRGGSCGNVQLFNLLKRDRPEDTHPFVVISYGFSYRF